MKANVVLLALFLLLLKLDSLYMSRVLKENKNPNVVFIVVNQFGLDVLSDYWDYLEHIKGLSKESIWFSHAYSQLYPASSRAALLTGRLPVKTGMLKGRFLPFISLPSIASSGGLPLSEVTLAEILKRNGYLNKFIGLWDQGVGRNGKFLPLNQGFDSWFGIITQHSEACSSLQQNLHQEFVNEALTVVLHAVFWSFFVVISLWCICFLKAKLISLSVILGVVLYASNHGTVYITVRSCVLYEDHHIIAQPYDIENVTLRFTNEAVRFIKTAAHKNPFFLMVNHLALSEPLFSSRFFRHFSGKSDPFLDSLLEFDWSVGSIYRTIKNSNLINDTIFVFAGLSGDTCLYNARMCNNSLHNQGNNDCYASSCRGNHSSPDNWEKQIQVPLFIKLPMKPHGERLNQTVTLMDIMPTVLELTNTSYSRQALDGKSLVGLINGTLDLDLHLYLFHYLDVIRPAAVTHNKFKAFYSTMAGDGAIVHHDPPLLFNLMDDPNETSPLPAEDYHDIIANISEAREKHVENRTRKWISQFEHPIFPWLFPCANFPYCHRRDVSKLKHVMSDDGTLLS